ncbi:hypothetical protein [Escherichia coli]|uniref:hypothetical protein n=1 Tax=Escherichia coli TaxID=562 RepID=UPI00388FA8CC
MPWSCIYGRCRTCEARGKIDDIAENQEQIQTKPDSQTDKIKEDMANAKARLAEENQQKDLSNNKNIEDNDKQEQSSKLLQKEKESITNKIKDKEKLIVTPKDMVLPVLFLIPIIYFSLLHPFLNTAEQWQQNILCRKRLG